MGVLGSETKEDLILSTNADKRGLQVGDAEQLVVTCALPYADGDIHIGGVTSTYLPADIFVRYHKLTGHQIVFMCASDDYGTPILISAEKQGKSPQEFVAHWNKRFRDDFFDLGINFDVFGMTSSRENQTLTQYFFTRLYERGYISKQLVLEPYCNKCLKFLPDRYVKGTCPYCGATEQYSDGCEKCGRAFQSNQVLSPHCAVCGSTPETKSSEHYIFKLSDFTSQLETWLNQNEKLQPSVKNYVLNWIKEGLRDWDITRDISWGVPIPMVEAKGKVLYGWFDNHLCYIAATVKYLEDRGIDGKKFWNSAKIHHFIGKDIVYHHYLFLPAMRLGVGEYSLPDSIPTRGHLMLQGQKFSKSRGWGIALRDFLNNFPADYLRFYLTSITPFDQSDVNFDWNDFKARINNELVANVGNFIHRTLSFVFSRFNGIIPDPSNYDALDLGLVNAIQSVSAAVGSNISINELEPALKKALEFSAHCNRYFQEKKPWQNGPGTANCLFLCCNAVRTISVIFAPFIPVSSERLWKMIRISERHELTRWSSASAIMLKAGYEISKPDILFRKIEDQEIEAQLQKLKS